MLVDTHCHLNYPPLLDKADEIVARAQAAGVGRMICVGTDLRTSRQAVSLAEKFTAVYAAVGIHPHDVGKTTTDSLDVLEKLLDHPKVVAVGEIGLDFYRNYSPHDVQKEYFRKQIAIACRHHLPFIVHNRQAYDAVFEILNTENYWLGVMHCFSENAEAIRHLTAMGLHISFTGNATYSNEKTERAVLAVPIDRLMIETDAPFILPKGASGRNNEPAFLPVIAERIAMIRKTTPEIIAGSTTINALNFFRLN